MKKNFKLVALVVLLLIGSFFWGDKLIFKSPDIEKDQAISKVEEAGHKKEEPKKEKKKEKKEHREETEEYKEDIEKSKDNFKKKENKDNFKKNFEEKFDGVEKKSETEAKEELKKEEPKKEVKLNVKKETSKKEKKENVVSLSVDCRTILNNMDKLKENKKHLVPKNGVIYGKKNIKFKDGESVYDVLSRELRKNGIHFEASITPGYNTHYIEGINNLYEFDCGDESGWMYKVNGEFPKYGASQYKLKDGDNIVWLYTCSLGRDIGGGKTLGGSR